MAARRQEPTPKPEPKVAPAEPRVAAGQPVEVDLSEPEGEEEDDAEPAVEEGPSRREKKRERQSLREQAERDRQARLESEQRAAYALGVAQATVQASQQREPQKPAHEVEADAIFRERELLVQEFQNARQRANGTLTPEQEQDFKRRGYQLERRMAQNAIAERDAMTPRQPQQQNDVLAVLRARYPEVVGNQEAFSWALARYQTLIRDPVERAPDDWNTAERVMNETRERFGMAGRREEPEPRRRFEGSGSGAGGARSEKPGKITLTPDDVKAANAAYGHLPEAERYKRYAQVLQKAQKKAS